MEKNYLRIESNNLSKVINYMLYPCLRKTASYTESNISLIMVLADLR